MDAKSISERQLEVAVKIVSIASHLGSNMQDEITRDSKTKMTKVDTSPVTICDFASR